MPSFVSDNKRWKLEWTDLGEGKGGEYDPNDQSDVPLLRADLYEKINGKWETPDDSSYCTMTPVYTDKKFLKAISEDLFKSIGRRTSFRRRVMEMWTWRTDPKGYL